MTPTAQELMQDQDFLLCRGIEQLQEREKHKKSTSPNAQINYEVANSQAEYIISLIKQLEKWKHLNHGKQPQKK